MRNSIKLYITLIIIHFFLQATYADSDTLSSIVHRINQYQKENYEEALYIRLDKKYYLSGEFLRFSVICYETRTQSRSHLSKVAYLELLDSNNTAVIQTKILLDEGNGSGEIFIPSNLNSGNYLLRGYTKWMQNHSPDLYFHSLVHIINPFKKPGLSAKPKDDDIDIKFFPEGGALVDGINSKVAFKATNAAGLGIDFLGRIVNDFDSVIVEFSPDTYGIGAFNFTPEKQRSYHAIVMLKDSTIINPKLPEIKDEGVALRISHLNSDDISIDVISNHSSRTGPTLLAGQTNGKIQFSENINISAGTGTVRLKKENIDPGIMCITLYDNKTEPLNERLVFVYPRKAVNLQISTDKKVFQNREKVLVKVFTSDDKNKPLSMDLSISVSSYDEYFNKFNNTVNKHLLLSSSVSGTIENPDYYLDGQSGEVRKAMDNLMLTLSCKRSLQNYITLEGNRKNFVPEYRTHIITGTLTNRISKEPAERINAYLSIPSKNSRFYATKSKNDGKLFFEMNDFMGKNEIIIQTDDTTDSIYQITIDDPFSNEYSNFQIPYFDIDERMKHVIEKASKNMQIQNAYLKYRPLASSISEVDTSTFFEPNARYYLDDYTRFPVMEEVMREYVIGVYPRRNPDGFHFKVLDLEREITLQESPLILLDGVPVFDADEIMELDPLYVEKIETVNKRFLKGAINYSGIVSYTTYEGDLKGYRLNKNASVMEYEGLQPLREFLSPSYDEVLEENSRLPDYRNVLYWNPHFKTNDKGEAILEFYTSDDASEYEIRIEGISSDGEPVSGGLLFKVTDE